MKIFLRKFTILALLLLLLSFEGRSQWHTVWEGKGVSLRGIDMLTGNNIVASGSKGSGLYSADGGKNWKNIVHKEFEKYDFRGVQFLNEKSILLISTGPAEEGNAFLLSTNDFGNTWTKTFESKEKGVFYDAIKFKNAKNGFLLGDPIDNNAFFFKTKNGGKTWTKLETIPKLLEKEASYAASNSSILIDKRKVWFCTQNRIFYSKNKGKNWEVFSSPFDKNDMRGIYGLGFNQDKNLIAVGGDYNNKEMSIQYALGDKMGKKWDVGAEAFQTKTTECVAILDKNRLLAVGTGGTFLSKNKGKDWIKINEMAFHTITCKVGTCYAAGKGIIVKADLKDFEKYD
jgi:photosystem II stability/assembly factor-like uncharacterized protein